MGLLVAGCSGGPVVEQRSPRAQEPVDPWVLTCTDPKNPIPALLWNGLIGVRLGRDGAGLDARDVPLPFFKIDEYEGVGEEKIRLLPNPFVLVWELGGKRLSALPKTNYRQILDMRDGVLTTTYETPDIKVECRSVVHPTKPLASQSWQLTPSKNMELRLETLMVAPQYASLSTPVGTPTGFTYGYTERVSKVRVSQSIEGGTGTWEATQKGFLWTGQITAGQPLRFERTVAFPTVRDDYPAPPYKMVAEESKEVWTSRWTTDIEIDGPIEDQQAIRSFLFYLRSSIHPDGGMAISPFGLSNQRYNGHIFWDADIWVFPALALVDPAAAKAIPSYRLARENAAMENFATWAKPVAGGSWRGLQFPWESSVSGLEVAPREFRREVHVTGSVVWMLAQAASLGLVGTDGKGLEGWDSVYSFGTQGALLYYQISEEGRDGTFEIRDVMSPDEHHVGDNDLYTNLLAQWMRNGLTWREEGEKAHLPRDDKTFLTYDGDALRGYKQAAAVLAIYPLQFPQAEAEAKLMMDRFADKVIANGPAMSDSLHALIWARLGEADKAYDTWRKSWMNFTGPMPEGLGESTERPLMLFAEKRRGTETYFTTGAAGCLQTVIYGFLGLRIDEKSTPGAVWSKKLHGGRLLSVKPNLPRAWRSATFRNFKVLGQSYTLTVTREGAQVTPGDQK